MLVNPQLAKYLRRYQLTGTFQGSASVGRVGRVQIWEMVSRTRNFTRRLPLRIFFCASDSTMAASRFELWTGLNSGRTWRDARRGRISHARCWYSCLARSRLVFKLQNIRKLQCSFLQAALDTVSLSATSLAFSICPFSSVIPSDRFSDHCMRHTCRVTDLNPCPIKQWF